MGMKVHIQIRIRLRIESGHSLHDILHHFTREAKGWEFPVKQSNDYQSHHGGQAGFVVCNSVDGLERAAVAVANLNPKRPNSFSVPNIVPRDSPHLSLDQYNAIGKAFAESLQTFLRANKYIGDVSVVGPDIGLTEIVSGAKCRQLFEGWLNAPTPTSHPSDVWLLDRFTCAVFRHNAKVNLYDLERHLAEDRKWDKKSAAWAVRRIQTGLDILTVNHRF